MSASLRIEREGRVLRLTLTRPEKRNALCIELCEAITQACESAERDSRVGAILLDAEGKVFCSGMDLEEALLPDAAQRTEIHERLFTLGATLNKPIVAAVQGPALAGGVGLVANAHVALAAQGVTFGITEIRIAMWPFVIYRAVAGAIGKRRMLELSLTGRVFTAPEALQWGLVHEIVPPFELEDRAMAVAQQIAESSAEALCRGMAFVRETRFLSYEAAGDLARKMRAEVFRSADFREGVRAFQEKRQPQWPSIRKEPAK